MEHTTNINDNLMNEPQITSYVIDNINDIMSTHTSFNAPYTVVKEFSLTNGIKVDIAILNQSTNQILALFESKGENVGIHAILTAIGQSTQYKHHINENLSFPTSSSGISFSPNCAVFIVTGIGIVEKIDLGKLKVEKGVSMLLIDRKRKSTISYDLNSSKDIKRLSERYGNKDINFISVCPYYFRDNRLSELYLALKICYLKGFKFPTGKLHRKDMLEKDFIDAKPINPGNARNLFITLAKLGFIDNENRLTSLGYSMISMNYSEFVRELTFKYFYPYVTNIINAIITFASKNNFNLLNITLSNDDIKQEIESNQSGMQVQFLTDSGTRYISHWLNVLRDDLGAISFESNKTIRSIKINYIPLQGLPFKMESISEGPNDRKYEYLFDWLKSNSLPGAK